MARSARRSLWACICALVVVGLVGTTAVGAMLPDGRAFELVSPPVKLGGDVIGESQRTRAAADGSAVSFVSLGGFGDVAGTGQATEYMSVRSTNPEPGTNGWATHGITPKQDPLTVFAEIQGFDSFWVGEFSADLTKGLFSAWSPVTAEDPNVVGLENLYLRTDLRNPGVGSYQLLNLCPACNAPFSAFDLLKPPRPVGASADFSHVVFETRLALTDDAGPGINLYEWSQGTLRLAGILPDSACGSPPCPASGSTGGPGAGVAPPRVISADGSRIIFNDTSTGLLYQRISGSQTVQVNASEKATPDTPQPATYQIANVDGTRVFFTTAEQLTDADVNDGPDLYMWDGTAAAGHRLTDISVDGNPGDGADPVQGVMGASDDGRDVYFVAAGQLVAGKPSPSLYAIYGWHDDAGPALSYIGEMANVSDIPRDLLGLASLDGGTRARVTPDGRYVVFESHSGVGLLSAHGGEDYDQTQCSDRRCGEFYVYSADSGGLVCASCNPSGAAGTAEADTWVRAGGAALTGLHVTHSFSDDGRRFFFQTAEALAPGDANGKVDVYEYDTVTETVHLISSGRDPADSYLMDASTDGNDVFFITRQRLVGWDVDDNYDLYDARVGGGFPDPPTASPACAGDTCHGLPSIAPGAATAGSGLSGGDGNVTAASSPKPAVKPKPKVLKCRKGFVRKRVRGKVRCVKKRPAKKAKRATVHRRPR